MARSWFPMFRSTWDSYINDLPPAQRWVAATLFKLAVTKPKQRLVGGEIVELQPGQLVTTIRKLADEANVSRGVTERAVKTLAKGKTIGIEPRRGGTVITLLNYNAFRLDAHEQRDTDGTLAGHAWGREQATDESLGGLPDESLRESPDGATDESLDESPNGPPPTPPNKEVRRKDVKTEEERESGHARARVDETDARPSLGTVADGRLRRCEALWLDQEGRRSRLACDHRLKPYRALGLPVGIVSYVACGLLLAVDTYADEDLQHVLAVFEDEAIAKGTLEHFNGTTNWNLPQIQRALAREVGQFSPGASQDTPARRYHVHTGNEIYPKGEQKL